MFMEFWFRNVYNFRSINFLLLKFGSKFIFLIIAGRGFVSRIRQDFILTFLAAVWCLTALIFIHAYTGTLM